MKHDDQISEDAVLGGRLRLRQPLRGHRVGHDAILLAAAVPARAGQCAADLGAGVGAAALALAFRSPSLKVTLVEIDKRLCSLSSDNVRLNRLTGRAAVVCADAGSVESLQSAGLAHEGFDQVLMNPPFFDARRHNVSPDPLRRSAHIGDPDLLNRWIGAASWLLKDGGVLTIIWRADGTDEVLKSLPPAFGGVMALPVLPKPDASPVRVVVRAVKGGHAAPIFCRPLVLNDDQGRPTGPAEAIMRSAEPLDFTKTA
jgi:tRNA1(Val) A37 N6-methylase TrmN6